MMKVARLLPVLAAAVLLHACSATPNTAAEAETDVPDWVLATPQDNRYAYGVGSAPLHGDQAAARRVATDRARHQLLASLQVTISGETRTWLERVRENGNESLTRGFAEKARAQIPTTTLDEIDAVEIAPDRAGTTLYVLVRLDRPMAVMRLSHELSALRTQLDEYRSLTLPQDDRLGAIRALRPAAELVARAEAKETRLRLVSTSPLQNQSVADEYADVLDRLWASLDALRLDVDATAMEPRLASGLREGLTRQGLRVGGNHTPDLVIGGDLALRTVQRGPDYFVFAEGQVLIREPNGRVLAEFSHQAREVSSDPALAEDRVVKHLADVLGRAVGKQLFSAL